MINIWDIGTKGGGGYKGIQGLKKATKNSERLGRRPQLGSNVAPAIYQFGKQNLSATGGIGGRLDIF